MKRTTVSLVVLALVLSPVLLAGLHAQAQKHPQTKMDLLEGHVANVDTAKKTVDVRQSGPSMVVWTVAYTDETYFSYRNEAASLDDVKAGRRVICLGKFLEGGGKMTAARIDVREGR